MPWVLHSPSPGMPLTLCRWSHGGTTTILSRTWTRCIWAMDCLHAPNCRRQWGSLAPCFHNRTDGINVLTVLTITATPGQGSFLLTGARYEFLSSYSGSDVLKLQSSSPLYQALCGSGGAARPQREDAVGFRRKFVQKCRDSVGTRFGCQLNRFAWT